MGKIPFILLILLTVGCRNPPSNKSDKVDYGGVPEIIDIASARHVPNLQLSEIADSVSYIRLSNKVLLSDIQLVQPVRDSFLLIFSNSVVYRYDLSGCFINQLFKSGRGPNEALCFANPVVNSERGFIVVNNNWGLTYKRFNLKGELVGEIPKYENRKGGTLNVYPFAYKDNMVFTYRINQESRLGQTFHPYDTNLFEVRNSEPDSIVFSYPNRYGAEKFKIQSGFLKFGSSSSEIFCGSVDREYWFAIRDMDTIFATKTFREFSPKYVIKPIQPRWDFVISMKMRYGAVDDARKGDFCYSNILLTQRYVIVEFLMNRLVHYAIYDSKSRKVTTVDRRKRGAGEVKNDIDSVADVSLLNALLNGSYHDNKLYIPINATTIVDNKKASRFSGLNENSNPVIMVIHFKK